MVRKFKEGGNDTIVFQVKQLNIKYDRLRNRHINGDRLKNRLTVETDRK
jgi:hypothetical protein